MKASLQIRNLLISVGFFGLMSLPANAGKTENSFGFGPSFFTGNLSSSVAPKYSPHFEYSAADLQSKAFNLAHRFELGLLIAGNNLAGSGQNYNGLVASYELGLRFNFGQKTVIPFLQVGPVLGFFGLITSASGNNSSNQAAVKYGYSIMTGFDRYGEGAGRGTGGWGLSAGYFYFYPSPSVFEFSAGSANAKGVRIDIRFHFGGQ